jgi:hypothetical protein
VDCILVIQLIDQQHETFGPIFRLQDAKERNNVLGSGVTNHIARISKCVQNSSFNKRDDLLGSTKDKTSIILEEVAGDGPDTIFLLGEGGKDVCEIGDIVGRAGKAVEFLL